MSLRLETLGWRESLALYRDRRMARILLLGVMSGFPQIAILSLLSLWLQESGFSRTDIGLFALVGVAYAVNALWAPLVDGARLPWLSRRLGSRRAWIVAMQAAVAVCLVALSRLDPAAQLWWVALWAALLAAASATQDVAIDALRIEQFRAAEARKVAAGAAMHVSGWWAGYGFGGGAALWLVEFLQRADAAAAWQRGYLLLTLAVAALVALFLWLVPEPDRPPRPPAPDGLLRRAAALYAGPVRSFFARYGLRLAAALLLAVLLFKVGEAFLGRMSLLFYTEIGFSKSDIALYSKGYGTAATVLFALLGSLISARYGVLRGLVVGGLAMAATNLLFALLAWHPERWLFAVAVVADQFTAAVSAVAFVAFLSQLCDRAWTATQYAALASLGTLARTTLAAGSGLLVDGLGGDWPLFFAITALMVLPSLALILWHRKRLAPVLAGRAEPDG